MKLTEKEIQRRLTKLRNYERMYPKLKAKCEAQALEIKELKAALARERRERIEEREMFKLQIEELQRMVFGRGKKNKDDDDHSGGTTVTRAKKRRKARRDKKSYRRAVPTDDEVTEENYYNIDSCPQCAEPLVNVKEVIRYVEDIVLPVFIGKQVEKQCIETGFCRHCRKRFSSIPIAKQECVLGDNIRMRVIHAVTVLGMTYGKLQSDLKDTFGIDVSDGEIVNILTKEATELISEYHVINSRIRGAPVSHVDETSCPVQKEGQGQWAWVKTASNTHDTIFYLGQTRGKGNAKILCDDSNQIFLTDDYRAYNFLEDDQALCWAHPNRKFRDLAKSKVLSEQNRVICERFYERFKKLMKEVQEVADSPYDKLYREQEAKRLEKRIKIIFKANLKDPKKLAVIKQTFLERRKAYLVCVLRKNVPMTNNKAERALRPLVIKRKLSFGHKTQKGADNMSILMSVCFTLWWKCQEEKTNFYKTYRQLKQYWQTA